MMWRFSDVQIESLGQLEVVFALWRLQTSSAALLPLLRLELDVGLV
jgi:hypothetical protein